MRSPNRAAEIKPGSPPPCFKRVCRGRRLRVLGVEGHEQQGNDSSVAFVDASHSTEADESPAATAGEMTMSPWCRLAWKMPLPGPLFTK
ncbi:hypothetical protein CIK63_18165 [Brevibacterium aurantiacum]|nr:hypothetical protein CIK63_18165 [Brevibacterium aurantiacum]